MGRRFGRNQKRKLREELDEASVQYSRVLMDAAKWKSLAEAERRQFQEFASKCRLVDGRGYEITINIEAMENLHQRHVEFYAELNNRGRERLAVMERIDPSRPYDGSR